MFENIIDKKLVFAGTKKKFVKSPQYIVLHHSGASAEQTVEQIHKFHLGKGWLGIGYNALVDKNGIVYWGRGIDYVGAHCKGYNEISVGICAIGNMDENIMPDAQEKSIVKLIKEIKEYYPTIRKIVGHKELSATDCPGANYPLSEIIDLVSKQDGQSEEQEEILMILNEGDKGASVSAMQSRLIALGYDCGYIDGIFGIKTKSALVAFQGANNISATGVLDNRTNIVLEGAISEVKLPQIKKGNSGQYVSILQRLLNRRKYKLSEDGIFGKLTEAAVLEFQKKSNIAVDGIVGKNTWHAILS